MYFLKNRLYFLLVAVVLFQTGCTPKKENLPVVPFDLIRFEQLFYNGSEASLEELQKTTISTTNVTNTHFTVLNSLTNYARNDRKPCTLTPFAKP